MCEYTSTYEIEKFNEKYNSGIDPGHRVFRLGAYFLICPLECLRIWGERVIYIYNSPLMWFYIDRRGTESETEKGDEKEGILTELLPPALYLG